jgi:glycine hydroxymethyltransferase
MTVHDIPFDGERYNVDVAATLDLIESTKPRLVIVGSSNFLFPHPVRELVDAVHDHDGFFAYDGSHVMGFLAAGQFQDPLREGADVVFGSTHKTFPGPQGGIIFSNRDDIMASITTSVRSLVGNHHPSRIPGMVVALLEMKRFGRAYMDAVRVNAQDLGNALAREGVPCVAVDGRFSDSHCVLARVTEFGSGTELALRLEEAGIITTSTLLPDVQGPQGIRLGVQEITRLGADEQTIAVIARLIADVIGGRRPLTSISKDAAALATSLNTFQYTFD